MALQRASLASAVLVILLVTLWRAGPGFTDRLLDGIERDVDRVRRVVGRRRSDSLSTPAQTR